LAVHSVFDFRSVVHSVILTERPAKLAIILIASGFWEPGKVSPRPPNIARSRPICRQTTRR